MKIKILLLFFMLIANFALGQVTSVDDLKAVDDSAFANYRSGNYLSAISQFKKILKPKGISNALYMKKIADCYIKVGSIQQAKDILEEAINCTNSFPTDMPMKCCIELADIYLKEKNYLKALSLYNLSKTKWKHVLRVADVNPLRIHLNDAVFVSKCYEGLDSNRIAINVLTPYVFYKAFPPMLFQFQGLTKQDTLYYEGICLRYLNLLKKSHSNQSIKGELKKAESNFYYTEKWQQNTNDTAFTYKDIKCGFKFCDVNIVYLNDRVSDKKNKLIANTDSIHTEKHQLYRFRTSPLYQMIKRMSDSN